MLDSVDSDYKNEQIKSFLEKILIEFENEKKDILYDILKNKRIYYINTAYRQNRLKLVDLCIKTIKDIQFKSIDDLASVKKLIQAEKFFSSPFYFNQFSFLKEFKFLDCLLCISSSIVDYANIEIELDAIDKKTINILINNTFSLNELYFKSAANYLVGNLRYLNEVFFKEKKIRSDVYKSKVASIIDEDRSTLEQPWNHKKILGNFILLLLVIPCFINKIINGRFLFFKKPNYAKEINNLTGALSRLSL